MNVKTPVTIIWKNPDDDWHYFYLRAVTNEMVQLTGADDPDGHKHRGNTFWVRKYDIIDITQGHERML